MANKNKCEPVQKVKTLQELKNELFYKYIDKCKETLGEKVYNKVNLDLIKIFQDIWKDVNELLDNANKDN